jgi:putative DNA primase/helicase
VLLDLLEYLCGGEPNAREVYLWVLKWLAYPIQHPGAKMRTALIFHGGQGAGKNLFFEAMMAIYGEYGRIIDQAAIEDKFNDWASRKLFLIGDEVVARQELFHVKNKLKGLVTGEWVRINPKNVAAHDERNHVNIVFLSNETQPLVLEKDDRRYAVIHTPDKLGEDFYREVADEIHKGGIEALHHHLLHLDLGEFNEHTKPPMTESKKALIDVSLDSVERFLRDWIDGDILLGQDNEPLPFCPCGSADLYTAYQRWCRQEGVSKPREQNQFYGHILRRRGWQKVHRDRYLEWNSRQPKRQRMLIPASWEIDASVAAGRDDYRQRPDTSLTEWMTTCFFAFRDAMGAQP